MAKFAMMYSTPRQGLDAIIEADTYKVNGKFFEFLIDKEVVRTLKVDAVLQIRRMDEDEDSGDDEEGDPDQSTDAILAELGQPDAAALDQLLTSMPATEELDALLASMPGAEDLDDLLAKLPELDLDQIGNLNDD